MFRQSEDDDVKASLGKAKVVSFRCKNTRKSFVLCLKTRTRIFNTNVKCAPKLLSWDSEDNSGQLQRRAIPWSSVNSWFRGSKDRGSLSNGPKLSKTIIKEQLWWKCTFQMPMEHEIRQRRLRWVNNTLREPYYIYYLLQDNSNSAMHRGKKKGRPRNSWRRDLEAGVK